MFDDIIGGTPFTLDIAESEYPNITGTSFGGDKTFISTLRALIGPRIPAEELLHLHFKIPCMFTGNMIDDMRPKDIAWQATGSERNHQCGVFIYSIQATENKILDRVFQCLEENLMEVFPSYELVERVTEFYKNAFKVLCFVDKNANAVIMCVENLTVQKMHYLQCAIPVILPWYFEGNEMTELEWKLIRSCQSSSAREYLLAMAEYDAKYRFTERTMEESLVDFEAKIAGRELNSCCAELSECNRSIDILNTKLYDALLEKRAIEAKLRGLELQVNEAEDGGMREYFSKNDSLVLEHVGDGVIHFACKGYVEYYDEDMAMNMIENYNSYIYRPNGRPCNKCIPKEDMRLLLEAIFLDCTLKLRFCAGYVLTVDSGVVADGSHAFGWECAGYMPNPHINVYQCMGDYNREIFRCISNRNYIGAIEQCIASCKSLNFGDSTVIKEFVSQWYGLNNHKTNLRCIELPDGNVVKPKEAIKFLKGGAK